jgi:transcriptional regulator with XRE-family HTH domain
METSFAQRVLAFRKHKGLSQQAFAEQCGLEQGNVSQMEKGTEPKQSNVSKLVAGFPDLNADWLLMGTGPMLKDGRALTQLPAALPPAVREGMPPVPGTATPEQADFVGKVIRSLEAQIESQARTIEWQQEQLAVLIKKPVPSLDAAPVYPLLPEQPRNRVGFATAASQECRVLAFVPAADPVEAEQFGVAIGWR